MGDLGFLVAIAVALVVVAMAFGIVAIILALISNRAPRVTLKGPPPASLYLRHGGQWRRYKADNDEGDADGA